MDDQRTRHGIACFCSAVSSQLMWAHYTNAHRGIALVYEWDASTLIAGERSHPRANALR